MKRVLAALGVFFLVQLVMVYLLWAHGYDFDSRGIWTGFAAVEGMIVGVLFSAATFIAMKEKS